MTAFARHAKIMTAMKSIVFSWLRPLQRRLDRSSAEAAA
jgi:hypothetical protein